MTKTYHIKGYYFNEDGTSTEDTFFYHTGEYSIIDFQRIWGDEGGELDEVGTIKANYPGELTEDQLITITNDSDYMDAPFSKLFPKKINNLVMSELESEYNELEQYVLDNEADKDCEEELQRMNWIMDEIARIAHSIK